MNEILINGFEIEEVADFICNVPEHYHIDNHIRSLAGYYKGYFIQVVYDGAYSIKIDGDIKGIDISKKELNAIIAGL